MAAFARRIAESSASRGKEKTSKISGGIAKGLEIAATGVNFIPTTKSNLINTVTNLLAGDKIFPFKTSIDISLETNYPINEWQSFEDISGAGGLKAMAGSLIRNSNKGAENRSYVKSAVGYATNTVKLLGQLGL